MRYILSTKNNIVFSLEKIIASAKDGDELIVSKESLKLHAIGILLSKRPSLVLKILVDEVICNNEDIFLNNINVRRHNLKKV